MPPHVVRKTDEVDLILLPYARRVIEDIDEREAKFKPALEDVEIVEHEEEEGMWC